MKPGYTVEDKGVAHPIDRIAVENDPIKNKIYHWGFSADWDISRQSIMMYQCVAIWKIKWK